MIFVNLWNLGQSFRENLLISQKPLNEVSIYKSFCTYEARMIVIT